MKTTNHFAAPSPPDGQSLMFHDILDALDDPVLAIDERCAVRYANLAYGKVFGYDPDHVPMSFLKRMSGKDSVDFMSRISACLESGASGFTASCLLSREGGEWETFGIRAKAHMRPGAGTLFVLQLFPGMVHDKIEPGQAEEKFRKMVEGAPDPIFIQTEGRLAYINPAACRLFAVKSPEELLGTPVIERVHPDNREKALERIHRLNVLREPIKELFEQKFLRVDGREVWAETKAELIEFEGKHGALVFVRDTTERKKMEKELTEKEAFSRAVMDNLPIGIAVNSVLPDVSFKYMNDKFPLYYRTSREALKDPDTFWEAVYEDPDYREVIRERVLNDMASGDPKRRAWENIPITRRGKEDRYISAYNTPVPDGGLVISTVMDVTQRIADEQALRKNAMRLNMLHQIDQAVLKGLDSPETIAGTALMRLKDMLHINRAVIDIFESGGMDIRVQAADADGKTVVTVQKQQVKQLYANMFGEGKAGSGDDTSKTALPFRMAETLGEENTCSFMLVPLNAAGKLVGALSLGRKTPRAFTSEEKAIAKEIASQLALAIEQSHMRHELSVHAAELERRVKERTAQYEAANKELEAFSYSVSHDLRAPLRSVDGYVQMLLEDYSGYLDDNGKRICNVISNSAKQMGRLIDDLLSFSRVGRAEMKLLDVDMGELARSIYHELTTDAERAAFDAVFDLLPLAQADPRLMRQVWMNLLSNAIKFSSKSDKTVIRVSGEQRGNEVIYSVKDQGAGFDQQYAGKLFGVFQRLHSVREFEGTGVGLAIVQRIISRHGGSVWAEGKIGEGATFYFSLKRRDDLGAI